MLHKRQALRNLVFLVVGLLAWLGAVAEVGAQGANPSRAFRSGPVAADSPALQALLASPMPTDAAASMHWPDILVQWGWAPQAQALRHHLMGVWVRQQQGETVAPAATVGQGVEAGRQALDGKPPASRQAWQQVVDQRLRLRRAERPLPVPGEIESIAHQLTELLPGLWAHRQPDGVLRGLFMWAWLTSDAPGPMAIGPFEAAPRRAVPGLQIRWRCELPRGAQPQALNPGTQQAWLCRSQGEVQWPVGSTPAQALQAAELERAWRIDAHDLDDTTRYVPLVAVLGRTQQAQADAFVQRHATCEQQGRCVAKAAVKGPSAESARQKAVPPSTDRAAHPVAGGWFQKLRPWLMLIVGGLIYAAVAHAASNRVAAGLLWAGCMVGAVVVVRDLWSQNWADSWGGLVVIPATGVLMVGPFLLAWGAYTAYELVVNPEARRRASRAFWGFMMLLAALLVARLVAVLTGLD